VSEGHLIGNHTQDHVALGGGNPDQVADQILPADAAIIAAGGPSTKPWFRLPFLHGDQDPEVLDAIKAIGYGIQSSYSCTVGHVQRPRRCGV